LDEFFAEWNDADKPFFWYAFVSFLILFALFFIKVNVPSQATTVDIYLFFLITVTIFGMVDRSKESNNFVASNKLGKSFENAGLAALVGAASVFAFSILISMFRFTIPTAGYLVAGSILPTSLIFWGAVFVVFVAPIVEEQIFRMVSTPTAGLLLKGMGFPVPRLSGTVVSMIFFAIFHIGVYGLSWAMFGYLFLFAAFCEVGNHFFKSSGFGLGFHFTINFIAWSALHPLLFV